MNTNERDEKGRLTDYALSCGCVEKVESGQIETSLWKEHGVFHVRAHDFNSHMRLLWNSYATHSEAYEKFNAIA